MSNWDDSEYLLRRQRQLTIIVLAVVLLVAMLQLGMFFADLLQILLISLILSYLFINGVDFLDRYLHNRVLAVVLVYIGLLAAGIIAGGILIPAIVFQVTSLVGTTIDKLPELMAKINQALVPLQQHLHERMLDIKVIDVLTNFVAQLPKPDPAAIVQRVTDMAMGTMTWSMYAVSVSVVTFYFLLDGHRMKEGVIAIFPPRLHAFLRTIATEMDHSLQAFFKGQIVLGSAFGVVMLIVYIVCGVQYALLLSVFLAVCEILPVIGPPVGFIPAAVAVAVHGCHLPGARWAQIVLLTVIFMVLQQVKDSVVAPRYMGNVIGMHPVLIVIAIMVGARLDGVLGIILALPVGCVLSVLAARLPWHAARQAEPAIAQAGGNGQQLTEGQRDNT